MMQYDLREAPHSEGVTNETAMTNLKYNVRIRKYNFLGCIQKG